MRVIFLLVLFLLISSPVSSVKAQVTEVPSEATIVFSSTFGSEEGQVAADFPEEAESSCPNSFVVDEKSGKIYILDQLNDRIQLFKDNTFIKTIPTPNSYYLSDLALTPDGNLVVLEKQQGKIYYLKNNGEVTREVEIAGDFIESGGDVEGIYSREDGIWLSVFGNEEYDYQVHITDAAGQPLSKRKKVDGILSPDGNTLLKAIIGFHGNSIKVTASSINGKKKWTKTVSCGHECLYVDLAMDKNGNTYVALNMIRGEKQGQQKMVILDPTGKETRKIVLRMQSGSTYPFKCIRVTPSAEIYQFEITEETATIRKYK